MTTVKKGRRRASPRSKPSHPLTLPRKIRHAACLPPAILSPMRLPRFPSCLLRAALLSAAATGPAFAHHLPPGMEEVDEFATPWAAALAHPFSGADHWLAALAVGLIAWSWDRPRALRSGAAFALSLLLGIAAGRAFGSFPLMETGLAATVLLGGAAVFAARRGSPRGAIALTSAIGAWHGLAHGAEMPATTAPLLYALGLTLSSSAIALAAGLVASALPHGRAALPRWAGASLAAAGAYLLLSTFAA